MTTRIFVRRAATVAGASLAAAALVVGSVQSSVGSPPQRIPVDEGETFQFPLCGIETEVVLSEVGTLTIRDRGAAGIGYYVEHVTREAINTNLATGKSVRLTQDYRGRDQRIVDNGDGTLTVIFRATYNETDYNPDGSVQSRSAGQDTVRVVIDHNGTPGDSEDDTVLVEDYLGFTGHDGRAGSDFCEWYVAVTS